jgi:hypothetical protein
MNDQGKVDPRERVRTRKEVIDQAIGLLGRRFVLQNSDLHAGPNQHPVTEFVMSYSGRVITGLEMRCAAALGTCSAALGAEGDPPLFKNQSLKGWSRTRKVSISIIWRFTRGMYLQMRCNRYFVMERRYSNDPRIVDLIATAYGVDASNVQGGPIWLETDRL